jgi:hypothetical protein
MGARIVGLVVAATVMSACGSVEGDATEPATTIRSEAISLELPPGWYGDPVRPDVPQAPVLRAATFPLVERPRDLGNELRPTMGERDILITVADYGPMPTPDEFRASPPIAVDRSHVVSFEGFREPVVMRSFTLGGHRLQLWVVFASAEPSDELFAEANRVLATLEVQPRKLALGGLSIELRDGWDGFAKDIGPPHQEVPALYVANVAWPDHGQNLDDDAVVGAFGRLPSDGIVIAAAASRSAGEAEQLLRRPVRLFDGDFLADAYEGQPAPHVSTQVIRGRLVGRALHVQVYFGRNDPTDDMRAEANQVLATLEVTPVG